MATKKAVPTKSAPPEKKASPLEAQVKANTESIESIIGLLKVIVPELANVAVDSRNAPQAAGQALHDLLAQLK